MGNFEGPIEADGHRVSRSEFEPVDREFYPFNEIDANLSHRERDRTPLTFRLDGPGLEWKRQIVYTAGLDLSDRSDQTIPIVEIALPGDEGFDHLDDRPEYRDTGKSAYIDHLRSFFIEEDRDGQLLGPGPIGECLLISQEQPVILFLKGVDRLPGKAQAIFFQVLDRNPRMQFAVEVKGDPDNLTIFSTSDSTEERKELDLKFARLLGGVWHQTKEE